MALTSTTMPVVEERPTKQWPPLRSATCSPSSRASASARATSSGPRQAATACGSSGTAVVFAARPRERVADAAALATPRLATLLDGDRDDQQADGGVEPPGAGERVAQQTQQQRAGEIGAEHVLPPFSLGRSRSELLREPLLGDAEQRHQDDARDREPDADPALVGPFAADQRPQRLDRDVGSEQEELDRDELLRARLGARREDPPARE